MLEDGSLGVGVFLALCEDDASFFVENLFFSTTAQNESTSKCLQINSLHFLNHLIDVTTT